MSGRVAWLLAAAVCIACGEERLIGRSCGPQGCMQEVRAPGACGVQFALPVVEVRSGASRERCQLFTLDRLTAPEADDRVFLTRIEVASGPNAHNLDVRLAPALSALSEFEDGAVDCVELLGRRAIPWLPLMTTQRTLEEWDFGLAPLAAKRTHRLLINDVYTNLTPDNVWISVQVNVHCAAALPANVSQAFEFTSREQQFVNPGVRARVAATCAFEKEVLISRLYRRTRFVTEYTVHRRDQAEALWSSGSEQWYTNLEPALRFAPDDGFRWECVYENRTDMAFQVGGSSSDACSLLGVYRLPGGGADPDVEYCLSF